MKLKGDFVTNSSSVSFLLSDSRKEGGDIISNFNASKVYEIRKLTDEEVEKGKTSDGDYELSEDFRTTAIEMKAQGKEVHFLCVDDSCLMEFLEETEGIRIENYEGK
jgi:hypothetical protein